MRVYTAEFNPRERRYQVKRRDLPMRNGEPAFGTAICLRPRWFKTRKAALGWIGKREQDRLHPQAS